MNLNARNLTSLIGGILALIVAVGGSLYFIFIQAKSTPQAASAKTYPVNALTDLAASGGPLDKLSTLQDVPSSQAAAVQYSAGELGKTDITKVE